MITDVTFLFEELSEPIKINNIDQRAIITNPDLAKTNRFEERFIHSEFQINMGDLINYDGDNYLILTETMSKRHAKYKALMRHCNFNIEVAGETTTDYLRDEHGDYLLDDEGRPIEIIVQGDPIFIPAIVEKKKSSVDIAQLSTLDNEIYVTVQDNEVNRDKIKLNDVIKPDGDNWKVSNIDKTKKGLLIITAVRVAST